MGILTSICLNEPQMNPLITLEDMKVISHEERIMLKAETKFSFSKYDFKELVKNFKTQSNKDALSPAQLKRALTDIGIPIEDLSSPESPTYKLLSKCKNSKKLYDLKKLQLVAILMGKGSLEEKAEWLFRQYDIDASNILECHEIEEMISSIIEISVRIVPMLAVGDGPDCLSLQEYENYITKLEINKENLVKKLLDDFKDQKQVNNEYFVSLVQKSKNLNRIMCTTLIRESLAST